MSTRSFDRKTAQLCKQAHRAIATATASALGDPRLPELVLDEVRPHPTASHLLGVVWAPPGTDLHLARERLAHAQGYLRTLMGRALSRKRVPRLSFVVLPPGGD